MPVFYKKKLIQFCVFLEKNEKNTVEKKLNIRELLNGGLSFNRKKIVNYFFWRIRRSSSKVVAGYTRQVALLDAVLRLAVLVVVVLSCHLLLVGRHVQRLVDFLKQNRKNVNK